MSKVKDLLIERGKFDERVLEVMKKSSEVRPFNCADIANGMYESATQSMCRRIGNALKRLRQASVKMGFGRTGGHDTYWLINGK